MHGQFVGPMPVADFLCDFVPEAPTPCPSSGDVFQILTPDASGDDTKTKKRPGSFEDLFIAVVKTSGICPNLELFNTTSKAGSQFVYDQKPDISVCRRTSPSKSSPATSVSPATTPEKHSSVSPSVSTMLAGSECATPPSIDSPTPIEPAPKSTPVDWFQMELCIECKTHDQDPFSNPKTDKEYERDDFVFEKTSLEAEKARGQLVAYASAHMSTQFRCFCFSVCLINQTDARLIRWDRSGAISTERFDFTQRGSPLAEFLWRFNHLELAQRGHDLSVAPATNEETALARGNGMEGEIHKVLVTNDVDNTDHYFLISAPTEYRIVVTGRASFGDVALDMQTGKKVWLKDSWRIDMEEMEVEYEIYMKLHKCGVRNIATLVCGGDVGDQKTLTQNYADAPWRHGEVDLLPHRHYRLVLGTIGRPLQDFRCTKDLVRVVHDALISHWDAYTLAKILHRDISGGNILMVQEGPQIRGILIDWDLSKATTAPARARRNWRTGTWRFMSAAILQNTGKLHEYSDDLESFSHVLAYHVLRYRPWRLKGYENAMQQIYEGTEVDPEDGAVLGGSGKISWFLRGYLSPRRLQEKMPSHLAGLINELRVPFYEFYMDYENNERRSWVQAQVQSADLYMSIMTRYLAADGWEADDGSQDQLKSQAVTSRLSSNKRKASSMLTSIKPKKLMRRAAPRPA